MGIRKWVYGAILVFLPFFAAAADLPTAATTGEPPESHVNAGGADAGPGEFEEERAIADPFEPLNRVAFSFNDKLYFWLIKPLAQGYGAIVPEWGRVRVRNVFNNISMPVRFVSSLFQFKLKSAGIELYRFVINSTLGLGGTFDVVGQNPDLAGVDEDLGQALGFHGVSDGFYIVWPVLGPSSLRDTVGMVGDAFLNPVNYITPVETVYVIHSYDRVNDTSLRIGEYEDLKESAVDHYISVRDAYTEHRRNKIRE